MRVRGVERGRYRSKQEEWGIEVTTLKPNTVWGLRVSGRSALTRNRLGALAVKTQFRGTVASRYGIGGHGIGGHT